MFFFVTHADACVTKKTCRTQTHNTEAKPINNEIYTYHYLYEFLDLCQNYQIAEMDRTATKHNTGQLKLQGNEATQQMTAVHMQ